MAIKKGSNKSLQSMLGFRGMNQRQDADKIQDNMSPLLINIGLDKPDTWIKRKGSSILGTTSAGNGIQGAIEYYAYSGSRNVRVIRGGNLDIFNGTSFSTSVSSGFNASSAPNATQFINRVYYTSTSDNLCYETGTGTLTTVGAGGNEVMAQNIAVAQNSLYIGNVSQIAGSPVTYPDRVYYSFFNATNNIPSDQLWTNVNSLNTMSTSTRFFTVLQPNTALFSYGVTGLLYAFTESACYQFDLRNASNSTGVQKVFDIGCCGARAITQCNGWMIWMDINARVWAWGGAGAPIPLSWGIEDDANGEAFINGINKANLSTVCAGSYKSKFVFGVGNVSTFNETINNSMLTGLITQGLNNVLFSVESYPFAPNIFFNARLNNTNSLLFGANTINDIYLMYQNQYNDNGVAIAAKAKTKFYTMNKQLFQTNIPDDLYIKYRPQSANPDYLVAKYAINMNTAYSIISDPVNAITTGGVLDMYSANSSTSRSAVSKLSLPQEARGQTISIEVGNSQLNQGFEVSGMAIGSEQEDLDIIFNAT